MGRAKTTNTIAEKDADATPVIRDGQIDFMIAVEICRRDRIGADAARAQRLRRTEGAVPIAGQDRDRVVVIVGHREINFTITGKIACDNGDRIHADVIGHQRIEATAAIVEQHTDVVSGGVGDSNVKLAIPVEVADDHCLWTVPRSEVGGGPKCAVPVAKENAYVVARLICHHQIELAVAIEIAFGNRARSDAGFVVHRGLETAHAQ